MADRQVTAMLRWNTKPMSMNQKHNRRDRTLTDKEPHIDRNGLCIVLKDEPVKEAYERLFQVFLDDYNEINRVKNPDRCMDAEQYFNKVVQKYMNNDIKKAKEKATGKKEHGYSSVPWLEYTMYLATPDYDKDPEHKLNMPENEQIELMKSWLQNFQRRNPNLYVFGAYIHGDEWGTNGVKGQLHMHLCLIPFEHCNRGLKLKVSEFNAYKQMGIENETKSYTDKEGNKKEKVTTLREAWKNKEVAVLDEMLEERGYIPYHPGGRGEAWEKKEMHQAQMQMAQEEERKIRELQQESDKNQNKVNELKNDLSKYDSQLNEVSTAYDWYKQQLNAKKEEYEFKSEKCREFDERKERYDNDVFLIDKKFKKIPFSDDYRISTEDMIELKNQLSDTRSDCKKANDKLEKASKLLKDAEREKRLSQNRDANYEALLERERSEKEKYEKYNQNFQHQLKQEYDKGFDKGIEQVANALGKTAKDIKSTIDLFNQIETEEDYGRNR